MGLDNVGVEIYNIHGYVHGLTVGQWNLRFWDATKTMSSKRKLW